MPHLNFMQKSYIDVDFQSKLRQAINLIRENKSLVAMKVIQVLDSKSYVVVHSFSELSQEHYSRMKKSFSKNKEIELPAVFPPTQEAVRMIESRLEGIIFDSKYIYLAATKTPQEIASTLVHEVCHFLNAPLGEQEERTHSAKLVGYNGEIRSFIAEKMFEKNGACLLRSDIKEVHRTVSHLYPRFVENKQKPQSGYVYSSYDQPML